MPNFASALRAEIARLARKETRADVDAMRKAAALHRADSAALRKRVEQLERQVKALTKAVTGAGSPVARAAGEGAPGGATGHRFTAKGLSSLRAKSGLSAADFGRLVGVSSQSIYAWEHEKTVPNEANLAAIADLRTLGKRALAKRLQQLDPSLGS